MSILRKHQMPTADEALPGRAEKMPVSPTHFVNGHPMEVMPDLACALFGMGCFWGAERMFWREPGVYTTAVGYAGGFTPNPTYYEVCTGRTGHTEVVRVAWKPGDVSYARLLEIFWQGHDPTQGMRQGNDVGTQYRSAIYCTTPEQQRLAEASRDAFQTQLDARGLGRITTEILDAPPFYFAEDDHQQYLAKNPAGYCGLGGTGVEMPEAWSDALSS